MLGKKITTKTGYICRVIKLGLTFKKKNTQYEHSFSIIGFEDVEQNKMKIFFLIFPFYC